MSNPKEAIREKAIDVGFDAVGFASAMPSAEDAGHLRQYLEEGRHGEMAWMAETWQRRASPTGLWPEAKSVIVLGLNYCPSVDPLAVHAHKDRGAISVYARGKEYHDLVKKRLKQLARWMHETYGEDVKVFVDTAPVMEKPLARRTPMGWQGKHTNIVSRRWGSWLFLGEVFTTLELEPDAPEKRYCGYCKRCAEVCPTGALSSDSPYTIDARRCVSYLTIEHKGDIDPDLMKNMGSRIYGCDDCLTVCPWNKYATPTKEEAFAPRAELMAPRLADLAALDDAAFRQVFAGSPIKRTGRDRFVRNVLIAIGNSGDAALAASAKALLDDPTEVVRNAARWALEQLAEGRHGD